MNEDGAGVALDDRGLTSAEVRQRVEAGQTNDVPAHASRSVGEIVKANVFTRFNAIIGVFFVLILVAGQLRGNPLKSLPDALFALVIVVNTAIGIIQELRAKRTLDQLAI